MSFLVQGSTYTLEDKNHSTEQLLNPLGGLMSRGDHSIVLSAINYRSHFCVHLLFILQRLLS